MDSAISCRAPFEHAVGQHHCENCAAADMLAMKDPAKRTTHAPMTKKGIGNMHVDTLLGLPCLIASLIGSLQKDSYM